MFNLINSPAMTKNCMVCNEPLIGRVDKRFCSDSCRNHFHFRLKSYESHYLRRVNYILRKNRKILLRLCEKGYKNVPVSLLASSGFNFRYITNYSKSPEGSVVYFCYEIGYTPEPASGLKLIKKEISNY